MTTMPAGNTAGPQRLILAKPMTATVRRNVGLLNLADAAVALTWLIAAYGLAERLVAAQEATPDSVATRTIHWWGPDFDVTLNMSLLLVGAAAAAVGSVVQQSIVFASRAGHDTLEQGWFWWYLLRPVWSALLGAVVVVTVNAGLISIGDQTTSTAGVTVLVAMGAAAGLYTDQVLRRLQHALGATDPETRTVVATANGRPEDPPGQTP